MSNLEDQCGSPLEGHKLERNQRTEIQNAREKPNESNEPYSRMALRKKANRKTVSKKQAAEIETKKKTQDRLMDRPKASETDESSSEDKYLEDYSTEESENDIPDSDDTSPDFSDEDKLMDYYENKLREHCIVGNIGSCSSDSTQDDGPPDDLNVIINKPPAPDGIKSYSQQIESDLVSKNIEDTKPAYATGNHNRKLFPSRTAHIRKLKVATVSQPTAAGKPEGRFNNQYSSFKDEEEPSCTIFPTSKVDSYQGMSFETAVNQEEVSPQYDSNKKVIEYLKRIGDSGLNEVKTNIRIRNQTKGTSYAAKVEEIQNSAKSHILKNYVSSFPNNTHRRKDRRNTRKQNHPKNTTSLSESEQNENDLSKDEVVDRILTSTLSGNTERNLTNLIELWKSSRQTST